MIDREYRLFIYTRGTEKLPFGNWTDKCYVNALRNDKKWKQELCWFMPCALFLNTKGAWENTRINLNGWLAIRHSATYIAILLNAPGWPLKAGIFDVLSIRAIQTPICRELEYNVTGLTQRALNCSLNAPFFLSFFFLSCVFFSFFLSVFNSVEPRRQARGTLFRQIWKQTNFTCAQWRIRSRSNYRKIRKK